MRTGSSRGRCRTGPRGRGTRRPAGAAALALAAAVAAAPAAARAARAATEPVAARPAAGPSAALASVGPAPAESLLSADAVSRLYLLTFRSPSGRAVRATLRVAPDPSGARVTGVVLAGGFGTGWRAAEYVAAEPGFALLSIDYPYDGRRSRIPVREVLARGADLWRATHEMSPLLVRAGDYLAGRPDVDSTRIVVVGASLGVPLALHAAAHSERFRAAVILYGCADLGEWVGRNLPGRPRWQRALAGWLASLLYRDYEPARLVARLSPRPVLLVNGRGDPRVSPEGARRLFEAAGPPREQIWIEGAHVGEEEHDLVGRLLRVTVGWLRGNGLGPSGPARGGGPPRSPGGRT